MQKNIAQTHQYVKRAKAVNHKHLRVRHFGLKTVRNRKALKYVCTGTAEIADGLENVIASVEEK